ncbi:MAG: MarR family transcriptional regulator, partial [Limnohabitans sp.]
MSLTPAQYGVLAVLAAQPHMDQTRLAKALAFDKVTALRVLKGLQERGLCVREPVTSGRRQMAVS